MAAIRTEDASDRLHLSLLSSPEDQDNPNTGVYSYREAALGQGTWIVIMNTGFNWEQFPEEFGRPDDPRPLVVWRVPEQTRNRELEESEIAAGLHWPPDDDVDYGDPFEGVPEGHGTQTAILAGGMRTGVARRAGLYLIKAGGAVLDRDDEVVEEDVCAPALVVSLRHIVDKLKDGSLPPGKTVIIVDTIWNTEDMKADGLDAEQRYSDWGKDLLLPDLSVEQNTLQSGTTFAAAIAAGQAACMLSDPLLEEMTKWSEEDAKGNTVGNRIKRLFDEDPA
ncbi:hypothetical protein UCDDA912_g09666 [Diaporthe ampelina]|uniref:Uncharacterized protein n=1 Tax=Diaporthe ampelina TaxID=1214573 RepID=A0A0G2F6S5_9PEZI|nr:hypothetical protein UCDDA912_g09666 [Diaporthe ampelina]